MEKILEHDGLSLIKKYGQYYIFNEYDHIIFYPANLHVTEEEALQIIADNTKITQIFYECAKQMRGGIGCLADSEIYNCLLYGHGYDEATIKSITAKLAKYKDIKSQCYRTLAYEKLPVHTRLVECGLNAKDLVETYGMDVIEAYLFLIRCREDPEGAMAELRKKERKG